MKLKEFKAKFNSIQTAVRAHTIFIFGGGFGEEREASLYTANAVYKELGKNKFNVVKIDPAKKNITRLNYKNAVVFNCLHGAFGESGHLPAILDYLKVPYTFSSVTSSALTADKIFFKSSLKKIGLEAPIDNLDKGFLKRKGFFIHKKINGGGSIGMYLDREKTAHKGYFTEEFLTGKILSLGVVEDGNSYLPLGIVEIKLKNKKFYDKTAKYDEGFSSLVPYKGKNAARVQKMTKAIFGFLGIRGCARIDFIEHNNKIFILEINSVPGLYIGSNLQYSAELAGLSFYELLIWILSRAKYDNL